MHRFTNRTEAGRELSSMLRGFQNRNDVLVLGLPRGGVPVAFEVAKALRAPLDVFSVRKLALPENEEFAIGAIATGGVTTIDWAIVDALAVNEKTLSDLIARERGELDRREESYRGDRGPLSVEGKKVIVVDDGLATGSTMRAAVAALRTLKPAHVIVAAPVASRKAEHALRRVADALVCAYHPIQFYSVGLWYADFSQTTDAAVLDLLRRAEEWTPVRRAAEAAAGAW